MEPKTFSERLVTAVQLGILTGVKWAVIIVIVSLALAALSGDYLATRQRAINGQQAAEFIQNQLNAAKPADAPVKK